MPLGNSPRQYEEGYKFYQDDGLYFMEPSPRSGLATIVPGIDILDLLNQAVGNLPATYGNKITGEPGLYKGGLRTMVDDCEAGWVSDQGADVDVSYDNVDFQEGIQSLILTMGAGAVVGLLAHRPLATPLDISEYQANGLWFDPSIGLSSGDLELCFDSHADCLSPEVVVDIRHPEGLDAGVWKFCKANNESEYLPLDLTPVGTLRSIGIRQAVDKGAMSCKIDEINVLRGTVWNKVNKPVKIEGAATRQTEIELNARANTSMIVSTSDWQDISKISFNGKKLLQDAIDGCSAIVDRYGDYSKFEDLFIYDTKGTGINVRDALHVVGKNIHGYSNENPVVAISYCDFPDFEIKGRDIANDDPLWAVRTSWGKFKVQATGGVGNLARIEGVSAELPSIGTEISVSGKDAANAGLQIGSYAYGTDAKVQVSNCKYGVQIIANALGSRVGGSVWKPIQQGVICSGDGTIFNGLDVHLPGRDAFLIYADDVVLNGCKGIADGLGPEEGSGWNGVALDGAQRTNINGGSFRLFTFAGMRGIKEVGTADYTKAINVQLDGNLFAASILGINSTFKNCAGLNPWGEDATPFQAGNNSIWQRGTDAGPTASTVYYIRNMDAVISSTNSGDANCAILIKDAAGVTVFGPLSSFDPVLIPVGWSINWGAFTGTAPDVPVGFN